MVDDDTLTSRFVVPARTLRDWVDHFNLSAGGGGTQKLGDGTSIKYESELSWLFGSERVKIKTWEGGASSVLRRSISTEISLSVKEFEEYFLGDEMPVQMTFPMKEFKVRQGNQGTWVKLISLTLTGRHFACRAIERTARRRLLRIRPADQDSDGNSWDGR